MPFRAGGAYLPATRAELETYATERHPEFGEMSRLLVLYGFSHHDDVRQANDGIVSARKFVTVGHQRMVILNKDSNFEALVAGRREPEGKGSGLEELHAYLKTTFGQKGDA
jgi:hypothetical protein